MRYSLATLLFLMISIAMALAWWADANQGATPLYLHSYPMGMDSNSTTYTILLRKNQSFQYETNLYGPQIKGRLTTMWDGSLNMFLQVSNLGGTGFRIERPIELDKPFRANAYIFGGSITLYNFVLSKEPDINKVYDELGSKAEQP